MWDYSKLAVQPYDHVHLFPSLHVLSLNLALVGVLTAWKLASATNERFPSFFFFLSSPPFFPFFLSFSWEPVVKHLPGHQCLDVIHCDFDRTVFLSGFTGWYCFRCSHCGGGGGKVADICPKADYHPDKQGLRVFTDRVFTDRLSPGSIPGLGKSLKEEMATHSTTLAWRIPWTEKPGRDPEEQRTWLSDSLSLSAERLEHFISVLF